MKQMKLSDLPAGRRFQLPCGCYAELAEPTRHEAISIYEMLHGQGRFIRPWSWIVVVEPCDACSDHTRGRGFLPARPDQEIQLVDGKFEAQERCELGDALSPRYLARSA